MISTNIFIINNNSKFSNFSRKITKSVIYVLQHNSDGEIHVYLQRVQKLALIIKSSFLKISHTDSIGVNEIQLFRWKRYDCCQSYSGCCSAGYRNGFPRSLFCKFFVVAFFYQNIIKKSRLSKANFFGPQKFIVSSFFDDRQKIILQYFQNSVISYC